LSRLARGIESAKESNAMMKDSMPVPIWPGPGLEAAWQDVGASFDRFCLGAGIEALEQMLCEDTVWLCGARHQRSGASVRRVCRNVKRWRDATMALRWTAAAMLEAAKGFRVPYSVLAFTPILGHLGNVGL
jgi:hypothetical protein